MAKRGEWWMASTKASTPERKHREIVGTGATEQEALVDLAAKLARLGIVAGEIETRGPLGPEDR